MATAVELHVYELTGDADTTHVLVELSDPTIFGSPAAGATLHGLTTPVVTGLDHLTISTIDLGGSDFDITVYKLAGVAADRTFMYVPTANLGDSGTEGSVIDALLYTIDDEPHLVLPIVTTA